MKNQSPSRQVEIDGASLQQLQHIGLLNGIRLYLALRLFARLLGDASLTIECADQQQSFLISNSNAERFTVWLESHRLLWELIKCPDPGLGETYMDGRWMLKHGDLGRFLTRLAAGRQHFFDSVVGRLYKLLTHVRRLRFSHDIASSYNHVQRHYDLGNDLYEAFLDKDMNYSCAFFDNADETLEQAQINKLRTSLERLQVKEDMRVLDIGCGWGATCRFIAGQCNARVTGITLAEEQLRYAQAKSSASPNPPVYLLQDYREHALYYAGHYDRVVSIGMLEHVGRENLHEYFRTVADLLAPGGRAVIHSIVGPEQGAARDQDSPWLTRYIFPGGYIPTVSELKRRLRHSGLSLVSAPCLHNSYNYAETLRHWRARFHRHYEYLNRHRYGQRFRRMWHYYLCMCEAMFAGHGCQVAQLILARQGD